MMQFVASFLLFFRYLFRWITIKKTIFYVSKRRLTGLSAEIAYHTMLGLFPAIIAVLTVIGMVENSVGDKDLSVRSSLAQIAANLQEILPPQGWQLLSDFASEISKDASKSWFSLSFIVAIWVFSGAISAAIAALDRISLIPRSQKRPFWHAKIVALILTIGTIGLLILASFLVLLGEPAIELAFKLNWVALLATIWQILSGPVILAILATTLALIYQIARFPADPKYRFHKISAIVLVLGIASILLFLINLFLDLINILIHSSNITTTIEYLLLNIWDTLSWPVALVIVATAFACIYRFGPSRWTKGTPLVPGAVLAALFWAVVSALFRLYVLNFGNYNKVYGTIVGFIVLMLWLYISSLVMLLGYQLNIIVGNAIKTEKKKRTFLKSV